MFPRNAEEMGVALNNLAKSLLKRKISHNERYKRFLQYWETTPRFLELKKYAAYNRRATEDEAGARWNAWLTWSKVEQLKEDSTTF